MVSGREWKKGSAEPVAMAMVCAPSAFLAAEHEAEAQLQFVGMKRLEQKIVGLAIEQLLYSRGALFEAGKQDESLVPPRWQGTHVAEQLETVEAGHVDIGQDQVGYAALFQPSQGLQTVGFADNGVLFMKIIIETEAHHLLVFHAKHEGFHECVGSFVRPSSSQ
jgi:hypothetical protein